MKLIWKRPIEKQEFNNNRTFLVMLFHAVDFVTVLL